MALYLDDRISEAIDTAIRSNPTLDERNVDWYNTSSPAVNHPDLIVIRCDGPTDEYDEEFYEVIMQALTDHGILGLWSGLSIDPIYVRTDENTVRRSKARQARQTVGN